MSPRPRRVDWLPPDKVPNREPSPQPERVIRVPWRCFLCPMRRYSDNPRLDLSLHLAIMHGRWESTENQPKPWNATVGVTP